MLLARDGLPPHGVPRSNIPCAPLLTSNTGAKIVSEMLGQATISITLDTYSHVIPGRRDAAAEAIDDLLS